MTRDFLFATWEGGGNVPPTMGAVRRLLERGHRVRVLADDSAAAGLPPWVVDSFPGAALPTAPTAVSPAIRCVIGRPKARAAG